MTNKNINLTHKEFSSKGGKTSAKNLSKEQRVKRGQLAAIKRWGNKQNEYNK